jgi:hypothetical protein
LCRNSLINLKGKSFGCTASCGAKEKESHVNTKTQ